MKTARSFATSLAMAVGVGAAMAVALDDVSVGIALGVAAFVAFGGLRRRGC